MDFKPESTTNDKLEEMSTKLSFSKNIIVRIVMGYVLKNYSKDVITKSSPIDRSGSSIPLAILFGDDKQLYKLLIEEKLETNIVSDRKLTEYTEKLFALGFNKLRDEYELMNDKYEFINYLLQFTE